MSDFTPLAGILAGIVIPLAVFFWLYHEEKAKRGDGARNRQTLG